MAEWSEERGRGMIREAESVAAIAGEGFDFSAPRDWQAWIARVRSVMDDRKAKLRAAVRERGRPADCDGFICDDCAPYGCPWETERCS